MFSISHNLINSSLASHIKFDTMITRKERGKVLLIEILERKMIVFIVHYKALHSASNGCMIIDSNEKRNIYAEIHIHIHTQICTHVQANFNIPN